MNFGRIWAFIERDLRKFFRSPALMMTSMVFPLLQLVVLGYAFGGKVVGVRVAVVDLDHSTESLKVREMFEGIATGPKTFKIVQYDSLSAGDSRPARPGRVRGLVVIPHDFSRRFYQRDGRGLLSPKTTPTNSFPAPFLSASSKWSQQLNTPDVAPRLPKSIELDTVEIYPYVPYIQYLLAGSIALSVFVVAMIGGGITFIDDKSRGLHEGYLVTPIKKSELVFGLIGAGTIKGLMAGMILTVIGGMIAGLPNLWEPMRLLYLALVVATAALAMMSFMFFLMVRVDDPLVPRAIFGVLNTLLFFPSGAVYPIEAFPWWLKWISTIDPFTYTVHALRNLTLKSAGIEGIYRDVLILLGIAGIMMTGCIMLFKRQL